MYVGGNGVIYVIDMVTFKLITTIHTGGGNIASVITTGNTLIIGEGGAATNRLLMVDINPGSPTYNQVRSISGTGIEQSRYGVTGMAIGPDGVSRERTVGDAPRHRDGRSEGH